MGMISRSVSAFMVLACWLLAGVPALAEKRVALVIGNGQYQNIEVLKNPANDASAIRQALTSRGFEVSFGVDLDREKMADLVARYETAASNADVALIYYAGHAVQIDGENYLLPVDVNAEKQYTVRINSIKLSDIYESVGSEVDTSLLFVDACRNDPFKGRGLRGTGTVSRGLAPVQPLRTKNGSFVGFATESGEVASDGDGINSPYTEAILKHIHTPDIDIDVMMSRVGDYVRSATGGKQTPSRVSSLSSRGFKFNPESLPVPTEVPAPTQNSGQCSPVVEEALWRTAETIKTVEGYKRFLEVCPSSALAPEAYKRNAELVNKPKWYLALYEGVDFWGMDIEEKGIETETAENCARACAANTSCKVFTFVPDKKVCYLKTDMDIPILQKGILSGVFIERPGSGPDIPEAPIIETRFSAFPGLAHRGPINMNWQPSGVSTVDACLRSCDQEDSCIFVTFGERQSNGSRCGQRFVSILGDIFGKTDKRGATAFDKVRSYISPVTAPIPLPGVELSQR